MVLTDEEIYATWGIAKNEAQSFREFARAIESAVLAKLKAQEPICHINAANVEHLRRGILQSNVRVKRNPEKHTVPLYEHPLPPDDVVRDAERYRFLRDEAYLVNPVVAVVWKRNDDRTESEWVNTVDGYSLDCHIDAAMEKMK